MRTLFLSLSAAALLTGCTTYSAEPPPITPLSRYAMRVEPGLDRIALAVHENGLSTNQQTALRDLAGRYFETGMGGLRVEGPAGDDPVAARQTWAVRAALEAAGVPASRMQVIGYDAPDARAPVLAGFDTVKAAIPNCAAMDHSMDGRFSNQSSPALGCAITANMAAQIADPRDIVGARAMTPSDSGRAAVVFDLYRRGEATSARQEEMVDGRVARAVE